MPFLATCFSLGFLTLSFKVNSNRFLANTQTHTQGHKHLKDEHFDQETINFDRKNAAFFTQAVVLVKNTKDCLQKKQFIERSIRPVDWKVFTNYNIAWGNKALLCITYKIKQC